MNDSEPSAPNLSLDEGDRRLIHALQINPRAPWTAIAPIVGMDSSTLARRWARIAEEGLAWVSGYPDGRLRGPVAILEVEAHPGATLDIASAMARDPEAFTIDVTAGGREMLVLLIARDLDALTTYVLQRLRGLEGVRATRTHLLSSAFTDAGQWRLRSLSAAEVQAVERTVPSHAHSALKVDLAFERELLALLQQDGRMSVASLSRALGASQRRVRESLASMMSGGRMVIRTNIARAHSGWPVHAWYFLRVPAASVEKVGTALTRMGEIRLAAATIGPYNLILGVWMKTMADVQRLEVAVEESLPGLSIVDRSIVLRTLKKEGHHLEASGATTGVVTPLPTRFM